MHDGEAPAEVDQIIANIQSSRKYRHVCADTIRRVAVDEWTKRGTLKPALKGTRSRLHQLYGAYERGIDYGRALEALRVAYDGGTGEEIRTACRRLLARHASTGERLSILDAFYDRLYAHTGVPRTIVDLACGLNPLSLPWMGLGESPVLHVYDIDGERIAFLNRYLSLAGVGGAAHLQDVICDPPDVQADVALLLKSATCLERQRPGSTLSLVDALRADWVVVSFPVRSLGRREKGMAAHYARTFREMLSDRPWPVARLDYRTELVFAVDKQ